MAGCVLAIQASGVGVDRVYGRAGGIQLGGGPSGRLAVDHAADDAHQLQRLLPLEPLLRRQLLFRQLVRQLRLAQQRHLPRRIRFDRACGVFVRG